MRRVAVVWRQMRGKLDEQMGTHPARLREWACSVDLVFRVRVDLHTSRLLLAFKKTGLNVKVTFPVSG